MCEPSRNSIWDDDWEIETKLEWNLHSKDLIDYIKLNWTEILWECSLGSANKFE